MSAQCGHCGIMLDTRTSAAAEHVMQHEPKGSRLERLVRDRTRKHDAAVRATKYAPTIAERSGQVKRGGRTAR